MDTSSKKIFQTLKNIFKKLSKKNFAITSPRTNKYNCIAWAAGDSSLWWEPDSFNINYWPPDITRTMTLKSYIKAYEKLGYVKCKNGNFQNQYEKIAIYVDKKNVPTHATRQLVSGCWTSKLGGEWDIQHNSELDLIGKEYGKIAVYLRRKIK